jgi:serine/threonine protein kinase
MAVWQVGVVMYQMLNVMPRYPPQDMYIDQAHVPDQVPLNSRYSNKLTDLAWACMDWDPDERIGIQDLLMETRGEMDRLDELLEQDRFMKAHPETLPPLPMGDPQPGPGPGPHPRDPTHPGRYPIGGDVRAP